MISERNENWVDDAITVRRIHSHVGVRLWKWWQAPLTRRIGSRLAESLTIMLALGLFGWSGPILRTWDPTAGVLDIGILSMLPLAIVVVAMAKWMAATVYQSMVESFNQLEEWKRACCYGCIYLSYFWAVVWVMIALL